MFWKINICLSTTVFLLFIIFLSAIKFDLINPSIRNFVTSATAIFFIWGTFLEVFQIPLCVVALVFGRPKKVFLFFGILFILLVIKMSVYLYIFLWQ